MLAFMNSKTEKPAEAPEDGGEPPARKGGRKKLILIAVPLVLAAAGAGLWFTGVLPKLLGLKHEDGKAAEEPARPANPIFIDLPDMIANLGGTATRPTYIKLQARLEVTKQEDVEKVKLAMPRIQDMFQTYLREMRPEELRGSIGSYRLREELLGRANVAVAPVRVTDVLFTQLLIQ